MAINILLISLTVFVVLTIILGYKIYTKNVKIDDAQELLDELNGKYSKLLSQKKSSEVRLGLISEKLAPFLEDFDYNPNNLIFLGNPIDYIHFGKDEITFIEVKSGKSRLSKKQRNIKQILEEGNITWDTYRIK